jgi:hypothetical protein
LAHELSAGEKRLFLLVRDVSMQVELVTVLNIPRLQMSSSWQIIGLSAVVAERVCIIARSGKLRIFKMDNLSFSVENFEYNNGAVDRDGDLLHCPWEITFMWNVIDAL